MKPDKICLDNICFFYFFFILTFLFLKMFLFVNKRLTHYNDVTFYLINNNNDLNFVWFVSKNN